MITGEPYNPNKGRDKDIRDRMNKRPTTRDRIYVAIIVVICGLFMTWALHGFN